MKNRKYIMTKVRILTCTDNVDYIARTFIIQIFLKAKRESAKNAIVCMVCNRGQKKSVIIRTIIIRKLGQMTRPLSICRAK